MQAFETLQFFGSKFCQMKSTKTVGSGSHTTAAFPTER